MAQASVTRKKWCKAVWREGDTNVSHAVPRDWVDKALKRVYWPPARASAKKFIERCEQRPRDGAAKKNWKWFELVSCSASYYSLEEAEGIATTDNFDAEDEPDQGEEDHTDPSGSESSDGEMPNKRSKRAPAKDADFTAGSGLSDSPLSTNVRKKQTVQTPIQIIPSEVGDTTSSQSLLPGRRPRTPAEKKALPPLPSLGCPDETAEEVTYMEECISTPQDTSTPRSSQTSPSPSQTSGRSASRRTPIPDDDLSDVSIKIMLANMHADIKVRPAFICKKRSIQ